MHIFLTFRVLGNPREFAEMGRSVTAPPAKTTSFMPFANTINRNVFRKRIGAPAFSGSAYILVCQEPNARALRPSPAWYEVLFSTSYFYKTPQKHAVLAARRNVPSRSYMKRKMRVLAHAKVAIRGFLQRYKNVMFRNKHSSQATLTCGTRTWSGDISNISMKCTSFTPITTACLVRLYVKRTSYRPQY